VAGTLAQRFAGAMSQAEGAVVTGAEWVALRASVGAGLLLYSGGIDANEDAEMDANIALQKAVAAGGVTSSTSERLDKAWAQLDRLVDKSTIPGRPEFQYALLASRDGLYPDVRDGTVTLKAGDVWKYGTTVDTNTRYAASALQALNLQMVPQTTGSARQVLTQEKIMLINYAQTHGDLPPGNKIFK
jgi:hypothetical protein